MDKDTRLDAVLSALLKPLEELLEKKIVGYTEKFENINTTLAELEKGTIKVMTEQVNLWELETGIYYLNGGFRYTSTSGCGGDGHIVIIYKPQTTVQAVRYIHFCGGNSTGSWSSVECGYTDGTTNSQYKLVDTSNVVSEILANTFGTKIPDVQAVKGYVKKYVDEIKIELEGDLDEVDNLIGGDE